MAGSDFLKAFAAVQNLRSAFQVGVSSLSVRERGMNPKALRLAYALTMPGGLLLVGAALLVRHPVLPPLAADVIPLLPYAIFAVAALLSWRFNRSRVLYTVVVLGIIYRVVVHH